MTRRPPALATHKCGLLVAWFAAGLTLITSANAQVPSAPVEIVAVTVGFENCYKLGCWTPVEVQLRGGSQDVAGHVELVLPDGDGVPSRVSDPNERIEIPSRKEVSTRLYARFGQSNGSLQVRFVVDGNVGGKAVAERLFQTAPKSHSQADERQIPYPMDSAAELIVCVGDSIGVQPATGDASQSNQPAGQVVSLKDTRELPTQWYGYEGVDRLIIATSQLELLRALSADSAHSKALRQWVRLGGRVVLCVGRESPALLGATVPGEAALAWLAPGEFDRMITVRRVASLEAFAEATVPLAAARRQLQLDVPLLKNLQGRVAVYEGSQTGSLPLVVRSAVGFGHVVFVAVDLDRPPFATWPARTLLVDKLLDRQAKGPHSSVNQAAGPIATLGYQDMAGQLRSALDQFQGIAIVPFWAIVLLVLGYITLIGPADYWLVKRVFKRMEATWVTFTLWVVLVSVGAYVAAYWLKGRDLQVNQVELVDVDAESGLVRGTVWSNVLSPRPDSYDLSLSAKAPGKMQLAQSTEQLVSWFGLPGTALGGMNSGAGQSALFQRPYDFSPRLDAMRGVPIQVWSTKNITTRWNSSADSLIEADLAETADQMLEGTIANRLGIDLANARLLYDRWAYPIPALNDGEQMRVSDELRPLTTRTLYTQRSIQGKDEIVRAYDPESKDIPWIMDRLLIHEAIGGGSYTAGLTNRYQQFCDLSQHLREGKAVLMVRGPADGSQLLQGAQPIAGEHDQRWTLYRFIFPVRKRS